MVKSQLLTGKFYRVNFLTKMIAIEVPKDFPMSGSLNGLIFQLVS